MSDHEVQLSEEERQLIVLALAKLSVARPGWDDVLNRIALKMDRPTGEGRASMYDDFRKLDRDTFWHKILDTP